MTRWHDLASTIRSKNAGVDPITFDVVFRNRRIFERVRDSDVLELPRRAASFGVPEARITHHTVLEPANASRFTIRRLRPSGTPGETDMFGAPQYAPLFDVEGP
jgi:hypothetical protein